MQRQIQKENSIVVCVNCITGKRERIFFRNGVVTHIRDAETSESTASFVGPGLIDLQINGINGIDFNDPSLTTEGILQATHYLLSKGITTFLPTVITNSDENIFKILRTIYLACLSDVTVNECIWGIHLEGPFISPLPGFKGAHDEKYIKRPDWELFNKFQEAAGGKIKLITVAPEWEGSYPFIEKCREQKILVAIGHSTVNTEQLQHAVKAGASLSTHLGNGVPLLLPRHPNLIWDQLACEDLYACIIADGIHIPDSFIKVVMKAKGKSAIIVSDATCFAGMPPGEYQSHIGGTVILDETKRLSLKSSPGLLAGAAKSLLENVEYLINHNILSVGESWKMASSNVAEMLVREDSSFNNVKEDKVIFRLAEKKIHIESVIKRGRVVF